MAAEPQSQRSTDGIGEGDLEHGSAAVWLTQAAFRAEAMEMNRPPLAVADTDPGQRPQGGELRQAAVHTFPANLLHNAEAPLAEPGVQIRTSRRGVASSPVNRR